MVETTYRVAGMSCGHCVAAVTSELTALDGVDAVAVDLDTGDVNVTSTTELDREAVRAAIDEAGYELVG